MRGISYLLLAVILMPCLGCYLPLKEPTGYSSELQDKFQDIPIPFKGGYEYLESSSFTYVSPVSDELRVAKIKIVGDTRVDEMVDFYKRQMEIHDFKLENEFSSKHVHKTTLTFIKEGINEKCVVEISRKGTKICVDLTIGPS